MKGITPIIEKLRKLLNAYYIFQSYSCHRLCLILRETVRFSIQTPITFSIFSPCYSQDSLEEKRKQQRSERLERIFQLSEAHGALAPVYGTEVLDFCTLPQPVASPIGPRSPRPSHPTFWTYTEAARQAVLFSQQRLDQLSEIIERLAGLSANGKRGSWDSE